MSILDRILETKQREVRALYDSGAVDALRAAAEAAPPRPGFRKALEGATAPRLIAEVKKASPSKGLIRADFDPVKIASDYEEGGASCLSVLTDVEYFQGRLDYLRQIAEVSPLPLLRKDFLIDEVQLLEAKAVGASAILLIAAALPPSQLRELFDMAEALGLDALVEVHDLYDLDVVRRSGAPVRLLGINNRDLRTFTVDLAVTERLASEVGPEVLLVSESGIFTYEDVLRVGRAGAHAVLVGESLMRQPSIAAATRELLGAGSELSGGSRAGAEPEVNGQAKA